MEVGGWASRRKSGGEGSDFAFEDSADALGFESARSLWCGGDNPFSATSTRGNGFLFKETATPPPFDPDIFGVGKIKGPVAGRL